MSGRKSTEVNELLSKCKQARKAGEKNWKDRIFGGISGIRENQEKIRACCAQLGQDDAPLNEGCFKEFPEESREIEEQRKALRMKKGGDYSGYIAQAESDREKILKKLQEADGESEAIRKSIRGRYDYCTAEYKRAEKLVTEYKKLAKERDEMVKAVDDLVGRSNSECIEFQNAVQQAKQLQDKKRQLEEKVRQLIELRRKAGEAREFLKKSMAEIDAAVAEKFMAEEFDGLKKEVGRVTGMPDGELIRCLASVSERIGVFRASLDKRYAAFLEEQQKTEAGIRQLEALLEADGYYEPTDYLRNGDNAKRNSLLQYIRDYGDRDALVNAIEEGMQEAKAAFQKEAFAEAQDLLHGTDEKMHQAMEYAAMVQENMLKSAYMAVDIRKVMMDFDYNVSAVMIDGNPKNGWKVIANQGGETINFERVYVNEEGVPEIGIDHTVRPGTSCQKDWKEIAKAMNDNGIFIERVELEDGTVIVDRVGESPIPSPPNPPDPTPGLVGR